MPAEAQLTPAQCRFFADLAREGAQLNVDPAKVDFLRLRLSRRLRALGLDDFDAYESLLRADPEGPERACLVEALTTHTTSFFREKHQYDWLAERGLDLLGEDGAGFDRPLTVWSAACSTGAELWSAAMVVADRASRPGGLRRFRLFGTDISRPILKKAAGATYAEDEIAGVSRDHQVRYLMRSKASHGKEGRRLYRVAPELRANASFAVVNLTDSAGLPPIAADVAFLRNVLIYFDPAVQVRVVDAVAARIRPGGFLLTGHAEAIPQRPNLLVVGPSIYRRE
jgi:chemotaxis protein methyltransferase CheR